MTDTAILEQRGAWRPWANVLLRQVLPAAVGAYLIYHLGRRVASLDTDHIFAAFGTVGGPQWFLALIATAISFGAVGRYDVVLHRILQTEVPSRCASRAGMTAIALSQTLGLGVLTGAIVRWRMLSSLSPLAALSLSLAVALSFLGGWAVFTALVLLVAPLAAVPLWLAPAVLAAAMAAAALAICKPALTLGKRQLVLPPLAALARLPWLAAIDTLAAAAALWLLLPAEVALPFLTLLPVFLLAFGAGMICGTPAGIGPFELTLLALLPQVPAAPLLAAVMAFRLVYFAVPSGLAIVVLLLGPKESAQPARHTRPARAGDMDEAPFAEANLLNSGDFHILNGPHGAPLSMVARRGQSLVSLGPALTFGAQTLTVARLTAMAAQHYLRPCIYKCDARLARAARAAGWSVRRLSAEAVLSPRRFTLDCPSRRQLRRKLRKAAKSGVQVRHAGEHPPLEAMKDISHEWTQINGRERGFSMGRFCPTYIQGQRVYLAFQEGQIVAFASFNVNPKQWALDLMRTGQSAPEGTMHALIAAALADAAILSCPEVSLSAAPLPPATRRGRIARRLGRAIGLPCGAGLYQFKSSFDPAWRPRYLAAPGRFGLLLAAIDLTRAILLPAAATPRTTAPIPRCAHNDYDR